VNRLRAILVGLILGLPMLLAQSRSPEENSAAMSDRVQAGLRGPVKSSHEESSYPNITDAAGKALEVRFEHTTVYDPDGRILSARSRNSDGSQWVTRYEYSNSGQLLKIASGTEGQALTETTYSYDPQGRIEKITTNGRTETPVFFRYDEHGGKAKVQTSRASDYRPNVATGGSPFEAADMAPNLPDGGTTTTIYDGHDRPTEVQVRDTNGELANRALRTYDAQGHVSDEKQIYDNLATMFPPETRQKLLDDSGLSADQLRQELHAQLTTLMKGQAEPYSVSYRYDSGAAWSTPAGEFSITKKKSTPRTTNRETRNQRSHAARDQSQKMNQRLRDLSLPTPRRDIPINMISTEIGRKRPSHIAPVLTLHSSLQL
jgi:YD repeat-containing protein